MGTHGWDESKKSAEAASSGGLFFKLENDGDKALVCWQGDPFSREVFWTGTQYVDADTDEGKIFQDNNPKKTPAFRCAMNAFVLAEAVADAAYPDDLVGKARMSIFENGVKWFKNLVKIKNKMGLGLWVVEIERSGKAGDTNTTYSMLPHCKIEDVEGLAEAIEAADENDLENPYDNEDEDEPTTTGTGKSKAKAKKSKATKGSAKKKPAGKSNGVIDADDAQSLIGALKKMDREVLDDFMTEFNIKRVKALPGNKLEAALAWIGDKQDSGEETEEVDPFA